MDLPWQSGKIDPFKAIQFINSEVFSKTALAFFVSDTQIYLKRKIVQNKNSSLNS